MSEYFLIGGKKFVPVLPRVAWDDQTPEWNYKSRTEFEGFHGPSNPPAVYRFAPQILPAGQTIGDYRVNLDGWRDAIVAVNGGDVHKWEYLVDPMRATYNQAGWPMQAYLLFSGNILQGERVGDWFRFETLKPSDLSKVSGMTIHSHPHFVHRFTCVTWDSRTQTTKHIVSTGTARGDVFQFVVSKEGIGYIPARNVIV